MPIRILSGREAWNNKGDSLNSLGRYNEAIHCFDKALEIDPRFVAALFNKGISLTNLGRYEEAIHIYDKALELDARDESAWYNKALIEDLIDVYGATQSFRQFLTLATAPDQYAKQIEHARQRIKELEGR